MSNPNSTMVQRIASRFLAATLQSKVSYKVEKVGDTIKVKAFLSEAGFEILRSKDDFFQEIYDYELKAETPTWKHGQVGEFEAKRVSNLSQIKNDCREDLISLSEKVGRDLDVFVVKAVILNRELKGLGIGGEFYVRAAKALAPDAAIIPERCVGGVTSPSAERVWKSSRVRSKVTIINNNVMWGGR